MKYSISFFLAEYKFVPEIHLKQSGSTYSACGPFTENKEKVKKYIYLQKSTW